MKKLIFLIMIFMFPLIVNGSNFSTSISSKSQIEPLEQFTVTLNVNNTTNLLGLTAKLTYDTSKLTLVSSSGLNGYTITVGSNIVLDNTTGKSGSFSIATLTFKATNSFQIDQISAISFTNIMGSNGTSDFTGTNSSINIKMIPTKSSNNKLSDLKINNKTVNNFNPNTTTYNLSVDNNTNFVNISATLQDSKSTLSGLGNKTLKLGLNTFYVVVTAENSTKKTYTIRVTKEEEYVISNDSYLESLVVENFDIKFTKETKEYNLIVDESIKLLNLEATPNSERSIVEIDNKDLIIGDNKITIKVIAEDESFSEYIINVIKKEGLITTLEDFEIQEANKITIKIENDNFIIDEEKLKLLKNKDVSVNIYNNNKLIYFWSFKSLNVDKSINTKISFNSDNVFKIKAISNYSDFILLNFENKNTLPTNTKVNIYVGDKYSDDNILSLYFFENNKLKLKNNNLIVKDGFVEIDLKHTSEYILTKSHISNNNKFLVVIIIQSVIIIMLVVLNFLRRKNEK